MTDFYQHARCHSCPLAGNRVVRARGPNPASVMIIGEAPGREEARTGKPFVGKSGSELYNYLLYSGITESRCYITNVVSCRPPDNRDPSPLEITCCQPRLISEIEAVNPSVIICLGRFASNALLGSIELDKVHGIPQTNPHVSYLSDRLVLPMYHPAYAFHKPDIMIRMQRDFRTAKQVIEGRVMWYPDYTIHGYTLVQSVSDFGEVNWDSGYMALDTESANGKPWTLQFSTMFGHGWIIMADNTEMLKALESEVNRRGMTVVIHNAMYDQQVLGDLGIRFNNVVDTMQMAYLLQDEPQGLKALAYRHLGMEMDSYPDVTSPATYDKAIHYLWEVLKYEWPKPEPFEYVKDGKVKTKKPWSVERRVNRILVDCVKDSSIDPYERWHNIEQEYRSPVEEKLGIMRPGELVDIEPHKAFMYAAKDADATFGIYPILQASINERDLNSALDIDMGIMPYVLDMTNNGILLDRDVLADTNNRLTLKMAEVGEDLNMIAGKPVNPHGSSPDTRQLLHDLGITRGYLKSTDVNTLLEYREHEVVQKVLEWRKLNKLITTYTAPFIASGTDRLHTTWLTTRTVTGRLASKRPNLMNIPTRSEEGKWIRDCFVAPEGCMLVGADLGQAELRLGAHASQDARMIAKFMSDGDIHAETAVDLFGSADKRFRDRAKTMNFGIFYGLSEHGMSKRTGWPIEECQDIIRRWFANFPGVYRWIEDTKQFALRHGYVANVVGRRRMIPQVRSSDDQIKAAGLREAINAPIQSGVADIIKLAMIALIPEYQNAKFHFRPILQIHDELIFEVDQDHVDQVSSILCRAMEAAYELVVPLVAEAKVSKTWGGLK